jgi:hypothetical protein
MRNQVKQASRVLLVFTETYQRRFEGDEAEGEGLGATFEGVIVTQALYKSGGRNAKFRPVVFRDEDEKFVPLELQRFNRYRVDSPERYKILLRWLHQAPSTVPSAVGSKPDLPPTSVSALFPDQEKLEDLMRPEGITAEFAQKFALKKQIEEASIQQISAIRHLLTQTFVEGSFLDWSPDRAAHHDPPVREIPQKTLSCEEVPVGETELSDEPMLSRKAFTTIAEARRYGFLGDRVGRFIQKEFDPTNSYLFHSPRKTGKSSLLILLACAAEKRIADRGRISSSRLPITEDNTPLHPLSFFVVCRITASYDARQHRSC